MKTLTKLDKMSLKIIIYVILIFTIFTAAIYTIFTVGELIAVSLGAFIIILALLYLIQIETNNLSEYITTEETNIIVWLCANKDGTYTLFEYEPKRDLILQEWIIQQNTNLLFNHIILNAEEVYKLFGIIRFSWKDKPIKININIKTSINN